MKAKDIKYKGEQTWKVEENVKYVSLKSKFFGQDHFDLCKQGVTMCGELPLWNCLTLYSMV